MPGEKPGTVPNYPIAESSVAAPAIELCNSALSPVPPRGSPPGYWLLTGSCVFQLLNQIPGGQSCCGIGRLVSENVQQKQGDAGLPVLGPPQAPMHALPRCCHTD